MSPKTTTFTIAPDPVPAWATGAVIEAGGVLGPVEDADALIWLSHGSGMLSDLLQRGANLRWVQLASAGIEWLFREGVYRPGKTWTCAKGIYGPNAGELAVTLLLCGYRDMKRFLRADSWLPPGGKTLRGARIGVVGTGGVGRSVLSVLKRLGAETVAVNLSGTPAPDADETHQVDKLARLAGDLDAIILAAPLTRLTEGLVGRPLLAAMKPDAWLVNVSRGKLVDTDALVDALRAGTIGGAGLDVTDPEPLPAGHPLWQLDNCMVTPHVANTLEMSPGPYRQRIVGNVRRFIQGEPLDGVIDGHLQY